MGFKLDPREIGWAPYAMIGGGFGAGSGRCSRSRCSSSTPKAGGWARSSTDEHQPSKLGVAGSTPAAPATSALKERRQASGPSDAADRPPGRPSSRGKGRGPAASERRRARAGCRYPMRRSSCQRSIRRSMACRREGISPFVLAQPGRPASSGSVMLHDHGSDRAARWSCAARGRSRGPRRSRRHRCPARCPGRFAAR